MSELRRDPISGDWVAFAPERSRRPHDRETGAGRPVCPFCPGNEHMTPPEIERVSGGDSGSWLIRVVENRYSAFRPDQERSRTGPDPSGFARRPARGAQEVVIESPDHTAAFSAYPPEHVARVFRVYQRRLRALSARPGVSTVTIFRNYGGAAGTSLAHPHSQIIASNAEPSTCRLDRTALGEGCPYCSMLDTERKAGQRVLLESDGFVTVLPFASRWPFEVWILPVVHRQSIAQAGETEVRAVAAATQRALEALRSSLDDPPYNFVIHTMRDNEAPNNAFHWHVRITPRLGVPGGFELATGIMINSVLPEQAADALRAAAYSDRASLRPDFTREAGS